MEGVRFLAGVLEPGPTVRATLRRISSEAEFLLSGRVARGRIESATLDFTFDAPGKADDPGISLEDVRFVANATPDPAGWTVTGEVDWSRLPGGAGAERSPFVIRWSTGVPGSLRWSARRVPVPLLAPLARNALPADHALRPALEGLRPAGRIEELAAFGDPGASGEASFWLSAVVSGFGATAGPWRISETGARVEFVGGEWRVRFVNDRLHAAIPSFRSAPYELTLEGEVRIAPAGKGWAAHTAGLGFKVAGIAGRMSGKVAAPLPDEGGAPALDAEIRLDDVALADIGAVLPDRRAIAFTRWYRRAVRSGRLTGSTVRIRGDPRSIPFPDGDGEFVATGTFREVELAYAEGWPAVRIEEAEARADGPRLEFSGIRGSIFDSAIEQGSARLADTTDQAGTGPGLPRRIRPRPGPPRLCPRESSAHPDRRTRSRPPRGGSRIDLGRARRPLRPRRGRPSAPGVGKDRAGAASHSASPGAGPSSRTCGVTSNSTPRAFPEVPSSGVSATSRSTPAWNSTGAGAWSSGSPGRGTANGSEPRSRTSWTSGGRNPTRGSLPSGGRPRGTRSTAAGPGSCSVPTSTAPPSSFPPRSRSRPKRRAPSRSYSPPGRPNG